MRRQLTTVGGPHVITILTFKTLFVRCCVSKLFDFRAVPPATIVFVSQICFQPDWPAARSFRHGQEERLRETRGRPKRKVQQGRCRRQRVGEFRWRHKRRGLVPAAVHDGVPFVFWAGADRRNKRGPSGSSLDGLNATPRQNRCLARGYLLLTVTLCFCPARGFPANRGPAIRLKCRRNPVRCREVCRL